MLAKKREAFYSLLQLYIPLVGNNIITAAVELKS